MHEADIKGDTGTFGERLFSVIIKRNFHRHLVPAFKADRRREREIIDAFGEAILHQAVFSFSHRHAFFETVHYMHDRFISEFSQPGHELDLVFIFDTADVIPDLFSQDCFD